ncbi:aspartate aminotransferase family protein [Streptomyces sp. McG3]|uniref:aspartate aminotransferase family protein n=1 Tax=Streptomyces sp. McG3 TaxID=2725483 RepID=UPI001BE70D08|nr:aminotransferase class III-fold pyridoxal phosphate-dependent enzyme [Streptomyces sp. McG3]MBT2897506.1 aspartate aminotransferase family protein [Streptomyces sp. McG3]
MRTRRQRLAELKAAHNHPAYAKMAFVMGCKVQDRGEGSRVSDDEGRSFLAMFDQYGNQSFGYSHPRIVAAVREQLDTGVLNSTKIMFEDVQIRLSERLAQLTGQRLPYSYMANGGGETIDNALKLARAATGRPGVISARGCFHGKTFATLSASNRPEHRAHLAPFMEHFQQVTFGDTAELAAALDDSVGAVLLEPVQAEAGVIVPPPDYLQEVRRLCTEAGALLVLDEMQTAFGRCGTFFAYEQSGITPDLVCVGKAFGGGVLPVSAVLGTEEVWKVLRELPSTFGSSLGGNPLSCRVGLESVAIASDPLFLDEVRESALTIGQRLAAAAERHPGVVAAHRGVGMMHGLEFRDQALAGLVLGRLLEEGITSTYSLYNAKVLRVQPPMVISVDELDHCLSVLDTLLAEVDAHLRAVGEGRADGSGTELSPLTRTVSLPHPPHEVLELLHARPRILDPFATAGTGPKGYDAEFAGRLGADTVVWADRAETTDRGVRLSAEAGWLWHTLCREATVTPAADGGSVLHLCVTWDTDSGSYEDLLGGRIGFLAGRALAECVAALRSALGSARETV